MKSHPHTRRIAAAFVCSTLAAALPAAAQGHKSNTSTGQKAGSKVSTGKSNTADGFKTLSKNKTGSFNTAVGSNALKKATGDSNVGIGYEALKKNKGGQFNVAIGDGAMKFNVNGSNNVALGMDAGALTNGHDNILIDHQGVAGESGTIRIGTPGTHKKTVIAGKIIGDGSGLTGVSASSLAGTISGSQIAAASIGSPQLAPDLRLSGNLGIGTTNPLDLLHLSGTSGTRVRVQAAGTNFAGLVGKNDLREFFMGVQGTFDPSPGDWHLFDNTAGAQRMVVTAAGNVGMGTPSPSSKLDVRGDIKLGGSGQYFATGGEENLRHIRGTFQNNGGTYQPVNNAGNFGTSPSYTVTRNNVGFYTVTFTPPFGGFPTIVANPSTTSQADGIGVTLVLRFASFDGVEIMTYKNGAAADVNAITFMASGPK